MAVKYYQSSYDLQFQLFTILAIRLGRSYTTGWTLTSMYQRSVSTWRSAPPSGLTAPRTLTCPSCSSCTEGRSICLFLLLFYWPIFRGVLWRHSDQDGRRKTWSLGRCCGGGDQLQGIVRNMWKNIVTPFCTCLCPGRAAWFHVFGHR